MVIIEANERILELHHGSARSPHLSNNRQGDLAVSSDFFCLIKVAVLGERHLYGVSGRKPDSCVRTDLIRQRGQLSLTSTVEECDSEN